MVLYFLYSAVVLAHLPFGGHMFLKEFPWPEMYGLQASLTMPVFIKYSQALFIHPPWQPMSVLSHSTMSSGDKTTLMSPWEAMANLSLKASEAAKAKQDPHCSWFLMG